MKRPPYFLVKRSNANAVRGGARRGASRHMNLPAVSCVASDRRGEIAPHLGGGKERLDPLAGEGGTPVPRHGKPHPGDSRRPK